MSVLTLLLESSGFGCVCVGRGGGVMTFGLSRSFSLRIVRLLLGVTVDGEASVHSCCCSCSSS